MAMNLLLTGAGAVGLNLAATLLSSGNRVSIHARGNTLKAIAGDGIHRSGLFGSLDFPASAIEYLSDDLGDFPEGHYDFILIATKTLANHELSDELAAHRNLLAPGGKLVIFQNGWGNDEEYLRNFQKEQICSARVITGCQRTAPNRTTVTVHTAPLLLGNLYGLDPSPLEPLAEGFRKGGFPSEVTSEIGKALWAKLLYNCTLNPLGAVLGVEYGALTECPETVEIMNDLMDEIFNVMHAAGLSTYWDTAEEYRKEFYGKLVPDTYHHSSSTLQDIRKKQKTEIGTLTGKILELGKQYHVPVPANTMLYRLIRAMEANYQT